MAQEIHEIAKIMKKKLREKNPRVCGAANSELQMGDGSL